MSHSTISSVSLSSSCPRIVTTGATNRWSPTHVVVGSVALDWLTLTTFDAESFNDAVRLLSAHIADDWLSAKIMQYEGLRAPGAFFGVGQQQSVPHYMVRLSGSVAQSFFMAASNYPRVLSAFRCTRVDVQYTHTAIPSVRLGDVGDLLRNADWRHHKGRRPRIDYYSNDSGLDTLYIGSRSSVRLQRIYIKQVDDDRFLRWEVEYKEDLAANLWSALLEVGLSVLPGILAGEIAVVPLSVCPEFMDMVSAVGDNPQRLKLYRDDSEPLKSIVWLWSSVLPCVRRLQSNDGKVRVMVRQFLLRAFLGEDVDLPPLPTSMALERFLDFFELSL